MVGVGMGITINKYQIPKYQVLVFKVPMFFFLPFFKNKFVASQPK
jgi:hypothetical protein